MFIGLMMTATMLNGCGQKEDTQNTTQQTTGNVTEENGEGEEAAQESEAVLGEVESVSDNSITIAVGTMKERGEAPRGDAGEKSGGEAREKPQGETPESETREKTEGEAPEGEAGEKPEGEVLPAKAREWTVMRL